MIYLLGTYEHALVAFIGVLFAFAATCIAIAKLNGYLPKDMGRQYAHDGALSAGKPRGAGIIFVLTFVVSALLFGKMNKEIIIYLVLIVIEMFTGFFDDAAEKPWGEYLKGILDLAVAVVVAISYLHYNSSEITLMSVFVLDNILKVNDSFNYCILLFAVCLLGYLWYNATPSKLLMGDAGSRAMGIFIAIAVLKMHSPFMYLLVAAVLIADGGLGLVKVSLLRFLKIHILKNTITPIHDHVRKKGGWSNAQVVFRFAIIQIVISLAAIYLVMI